MRNAAIWYLCGATLSAVGAYIMAGLGLACLTLGIALVIAVAIALARG